MKVSIETFQITLKRTLHNHCYPCRTTGWVKQYRVPRPYRWRETAVRKSLPSPSIRSAVASLRTTCSGLCRFLVVIVIKPSCPHPGRQVPLDLNQRDGVRPCRGSWAAWYRKRSIAGWHRTAWNRRSAHWAVNGQPRPVPPSVVGHELLPDDVRRQQCEAAGPHAVTLTEASWRWLMGEQ